MLRTSRDTLYVGQTNNLERRLKQHTDKRGQGAKYLRCFDSFALVYMEEFSSRSEAMRREYEMKQLTKKQKEALVSST